MVDPSEPSPINRFLQQNDLQLAGILLTHHHLDHIGGVAELVKMHRCPVYGAAADQSRLPVTHLVQSDTDVSIENWQFRMTPIPGHTLGHVAWIEPQLQAIFCGDTLFSLGCGRLFEGTPEQMVESLKRLALWPETYHIYCGHEYTLDNLRFCKAIDRKTDWSGVDLQIRQRLKHEGKTIPSSLAFERRYNPFLRAALQPDSVSQFRYLRERKDHF